jgi:hypothetical protein
MNKEQALSTTQDGLAEIFKETMANYRQATSREKPVYEERAVNVAHAVAAVAAHQVPR